MENILLSLWLYSPLDLRRFFSFLSYTQRVEFPGRGISPLPTHGKTQKQVKRTQTPMLRVGFEPQNPVFERANTVHASERAANDIG
jgi:hypothetical protein